MAYFFVILIFVIAVATLLTSKKENNKTLQQKKEDFLNTDAYIFGEKFKVRDFQNIDQTKIRKELAELKRKNKAFADAQNKYFSFVKKGGKFEKDKKLSRAILEYEKGLIYAYNEPILKIHNYAHSIHRLIILYGKTKQKSKLKIHLKNSIERHPDYRDAADWKKRLIKIKE